MPFRPNNVSSLLTAQGHGLQALEKQSAIHRELEDALMRTTSAQEALQADTASLQAENARLEQALQEAQKVSTSGVSGLIFCMTTMPWLSIYS